MPRYAERKSDRISLHDAAEDKVEIRDGKFSTLSLSQGQRKRLALLSSFLEDRPFYVFDEWAADQDPLFKEFFYRTLLPELKLKKKAVLVITHDDRYFSLADQVIRLGFGKMEAPDSQMELDIVS
jgi:putative ATP-binding cassette transporter